MGRSLLTTLTLYLCMVALTPANACWTDHNLRGMIQDVKNLVPDNLQWVVEEYSEQFYTGFSSVSASGVNSKNDELQIILNYSDEAVSAFSKQMSYKEGAHLLGTVARLISDLHRIPDSKSKLRNPDWKTDYAIFLQKKRPFFRIRWNGADNRPRNKDALKRLLSHSIDQMDRVSTILTETLNRENKPVESYDVRSAPFGIGSIAYSSSVNTIAMTWLYIWDQAGGL